MGFTKEQNENLGHDSPRKAKGNSILVISLLIIIIILLIVLIYLLITSLTINKETDNKGNSNNEIVDDKIEEIDRKFYLIYYFENCLMGIKSNGAKEILINGVTNKYVSYAVYENILYYIDNAHVLHSFDLESLRDISLNIKVSEENDWNMYAGNDFIILTGVRNVLKYNLTDGKMELLPFENYNYNYLDNDNNLFYYTDSDGKLYSYSLITKESIPIFSADDSRVIYGYGSYIIYAKYTANGTSEQFYLYDSKTKISTLCKDIESDSLFIYGERVFAIDDKRVVAFDESGSANIAVFDDVDLISSIHLIKDSVLVNTVDIDEDSCNNATDVCLPARTYNSYLVNIESGDIEKLDSSYEFLFEGFPGFVYVKGAKI